LSGEELDAVLSMPGEHTMLHLYDGSEINFMGEDVVWDADLSVVFLFPEQERGGQV